MKSIRLARLYGQPVKMGEKANILFLEIAIQPLLGMVFGFFCANVAFSGRERNTAEALS